MKPIEEAKLNVLSALKTELAKIDSVSTIDADFKVSQTARNLVKTFAILDDFEDYEED